MPAFVYGLFAKWNAAPTWAKAAILAVVGIIVWAVVMVAIAWGHGAEAAGGGALVAGALKVARDQAAAREKALLATQQAKAASRTAGQIVDDAKAKAEATKAATAAASDDSVREDANRLL